MKTFTFLFTALLTFGVLAQESTPVQYRRSCPIPADPDPVRSMEELRPVLEANNIEILENNTVTALNVEKFLSNYNMMPENLRNEMISGGARIRLMEGTGVGIDPSLRAIRTAEGTREWINVPGAGGLPSDGTPTRIAINHLYDNHGSLNLVLHEHAHTLDSLYGEHTLSSSPAFRNLLTSSPRAEEFLNMLCADRYCTPDKPVEAFAELFTYYHGCAESKNHMEEIVPEIARFFSEFNSARDLLDRVVSNTNTPSEECDTSPTADFSKNIADITAVAAQVKKTYPPASLKPGSTSVSAAGMR